MTPITAYTTDSSNALPLYVLDRDGFAAWKAQQPAAVQAVVDCFKGQAPATLAAQKYKLDPGTRVRQFAFQKAVF